MVYGPEVDQSDRTARQKNVTWRHKKWEDTAQQSMVGAAVWKVAGADEEK